MDGIWAEELYWIQKSFCSFGISVNVEGSEDAEIYCLKAGEVAALAAPAIIDFTCKVLQEDESAKKTHSPVWTKKMWGEL